MSFKPIFLVKELMKNTLDERVINFEFLPKHSNPSTEYYRRKIDNDIFCELRVEFGPALKLRFEKVKFLEHEIFINFKPAVMYSIPNSNLKSREDSVNIFFNQYLLDCEKEAT